MNVSFKRISGTLWCGSAQPVQCQWYRQIPGPVSGLYPEQSCIGYRKKKGGRGEKLKYAWYVFRREHCGICSFTLNSERKGSKFDLCSLPRALRFLSVAVKWDKASKNISCSSHWSHPAPAATVCSALPDEILLLELGLWNWAGFMRNCFKSPVLPISPQWNI